MKQRFCFLCAAFFILSFALLPAEAAWTEKKEGGFSVEAFLSATKLPVDELLQVSLRFQYPETHSIDLDKVRINLLKYAGLSEPPFALVSEKVENLPDGKLLTIQLEPLLEGVHFLSLYDIVFPSKDPEASSVVIISKIFEIEITLPEIDQSYRGLSFPLLSLLKRYPITLTAENRRDLEDPRLQEIEAQRNEEIFKQKTLPWPEIAGIGLFAILVLIAKLQPERRKDLEKEKKKRVMTARKKAIKALSLLDSEKLPQKNEFERYYVSLTLTVRKYIEEHYQIPASTRTTIEFLSTMAKNPAFDDETKKLLKNFLTSSDRVKFAAHAPTLQECENARLMARQFIEFIPK